MTEAENHKETRFGFGKNWTRFLEQVNEARIANAQKSLQDMLQTDDLNGRTFLDIGSGSGLFSLVARQLGASVHSFDYDPHSVNCTREMQHRYRRNDPDWQVESGDALATRYMEGLGQFDIVYSWGVLHHTGNMWRALANAADRVTEGGTLYIAIYNDQGILSTLWKGIKYVYNVLPRPLRPVYTAAVMAPHETAYALRCALTGHLEDYLRRWTDQPGDTVRGMSRWYDMVDWVGGYPFEVASHEAIIRFYEARGFESKKTRSVGKGLGCNEFVFTLPRTRSH